MIGSAAVRSAVLLLPAAALLAAIPSGTAGQAAPDAAASAAHPGAAVPGPRWTTWPRTRGVDGGTAGRRTPANPARRPLQGGGARSPALLAAGGVVGGAAGFFGLGLLGAWIADESADPGEDLAAVGGFALGGLTGEVLGVAAGVHMADGGRGSFWADLGASALTGAAALAVLAVADTDGAAAWSLAGAGAALQVGLTVHTELGGS